MLFFLPYFEGGKKKAWFFFLSVCLSVVLVGCCCTAVEILPSFPVNTEDKYLNLIRR